MASVPLELFEIHFDDRASGPRCLKGKVYEQKEPALRIRMVGPAPLAATVYELERLRCNLCGDVFGAEVPEGVGEKNTTRAQRR